MEMNQILTNMKRVQNRIEELFALAPDSGGGARRLAYSPEEARAMLLVAEWIEDAGLSARLDEFGNLWGLPPGKEPFVTSGSHVDTVPNGGRHDGALGTVLAIEAAENLSGSFGVLVCAAEEGARFGAGTIGSRSLVGKLSDGNLEEMRDSEGISVAQAREEFLPLLAAIPSVEGSDPLSRLAGHAEIHIEQRRDLKKKGASLGIATAIAGPMRYQLRFTGVTAHSGETPVEDRRDALCAAAETVLLAERLTRDEASTVVTASTMQVHPNSLTAIPGEVTLGVDVRGADAKEAERIVSELFDGSEAASEKRGVELSAQTLSFTKPVALDERTVDLAEAVCRGFGLPASRCVSLAGHDVQHLAELVPAMLFFTPSTNGVSHAPEESVDWQDVESALEILVRFLPELGRLHKESGR